MHFPVMNGKNGFKEIDSPVQMRLYSLSKHQFVLVIACFILFFGITLMIGILGPQAIGQVTKTARQLNVPVKNFKTGPYLLNSNVLTQFNQELWFSAEVQLSGLPSHNRGFMFTRDFYISVKILGSSKDTSFKLINHAYRNRTRHMQCSGSKCNPIVIFHLGTIEYPSYNVNVTFYGLNLPAGVKIRNIIFSFKYYEDQFTQMEIWFRFAFLVLSFTISCLFTHSLRKFPMRDWCIEQRWMSALLPLLLLYNNPLFPLNFLLQSWISKFFDAVFQASYCSGLLMFWLCAYHGIRQKDRKFVNFYLPKIIIVGLIWATGCSLLAWQNLNEMRDPSYQYKVDVKHFMNLKIFFFVIAGIYIVYLIYLIVQAFRELRNLPLFDVRFRFLTILMLLVVVISLIAIFIRFGSTVLEESFVMDVTSSYQNSAEFLAFYGLFNFYLYTMAFMYSPSPAAIRDACTTKTVPSSFVTMTNGDLVNDSDDELIYSRKHDDFDHANEVDDKSNH